MNFGIKKGGSTRDYIGNEMIYADKNASNQIRQIQVMKSGVVKTVWQYDVTAPVLTLNQSTSSKHYLLNTNSFTISGTVSDSESGVASVSVNGTVVSTSAGSFSTTITVNSGNQTHTIIAIDKAGNSTSKTLQTYYTTSTKNTAPYNVGGQPTDNMQHSYSVEVSQVIPRGCKTITLSASAGCYFDNTGWGGHSIRVYHYIKDDTTGAILATYDSGSNTSDKSVSNSITVTLTPYQGFEHQISVYSYATAYSGGDSSGIVWRSISAYASASVSYY